MPFKELSDEIINKLCKYNNLDKSKFKLLCLFSLEPKSHLTYTGNNHFNKYDVTINEDSVNYDLLYNDSLHNIKKSDYKEAINLINSMNIDNKHEQNFVSRLYEILGYINRDNNFLVPVEKSRVKENFEYNDSIIESYDVSAFKISDDCSDKTYFSNFPLIYNEELSFNILNSLDKHKYLFMEVRASKIDIYNYMYFLNDSQYVIVPVYIIKEFYNRNDYNSYPFLKYKGALKRLKDHFYLKNSIVFQPLNKIYDLDKTKYNFYTLFFSQDIPLSGFTIENFKSSLRRLVTVGYNLESASDYSFSHIPKGGIQLLYEKKSIYYIYSIYENILKFIIKFMPDALINSGCSESNLKDSTLDKFLSNRNNQKYFNLLINKFYKSKYSVIIGYNVLTNNEKLENYLLRNNLLISHIYFRKLLQKRKDEEYGYNN